MGDSVKDDMRTFLCFVACDSQRHNCHHVFVVVIVVIVVVFVANANSQRVTEFRANGWRRHAIARPSNNEWPDFPFPTTTTTNQIIKIVKRNAPSYNRALFIGSFLFNFHFTVYRGKCQGNTCIAWAWCMVHTSYVHTKMYFCLCHRHSMQFKETVDFKKTCSTSAAIIYSSFSV